MPELDADLVRLLALGLLALIAIMLIAIVSSMGKLRKSIERAISERAPESRWSSPQEMAPEPHAEAVSVTHEPEAVRAEPEPQPAAAVSAEPVATAAPEPIQTQATAPEHAQAAAAPADIAPQPAAVEQQAAPAAQEEPQEQPFERDGRWWFRRGEELLVYEETSGQWVPAPQQAAVTAPAGQPSPTTIRDIAGSEPAPQQAEPAPQQAGFWKCPSCGAVNGSTATTCRMCFAARP
jgi:hypothetical protein